MKYLEIKSLETFLKQVEENLLGESNRRSVLYSADAIETWDSARIIKDNEVLFASASGSANVYAIFTAAKGSEDYSLKYIGKSRKSFARTRLTNHLVKKNINTGSKLDAITKHIRAGGSIKVSWVSIEPESLRNYVEEELINKHPESVWNKHARKNA